MIYIELGQLDYAIETLLIAIENNPENFDYSAYFILATSYMLKKNYQNAIKYLETALRLNPEHIPIMNSLATCYMNTMNYKKDVIIYGIS